MKKIIVILFSAALGISFLFIGFGSYLGQSYVLKVGKNKITESEFLRELDTYKKNNELFLERGGFYCFKLYLHK